MAGLRGSSGDCVPDSFSWNLSSCPSWKVGAVSSAWSEENCMQWESLAGEQVDTGCGEKCGSTGLWDTGNVGPQRSPLSLPFLNISIYMCTSNFIYMVLYTDEHI